MIEVRSERRRAAPTRSLRGGIADGTPQGGAPSAALLRSLRAHDPALELIWLRLIGRWALYRVVRRAAVRSEDVLVKEFVLTGPRGEYREPGSWLISWLQQNDKTRGGSIDFGRATRAYLKSLEDDEARREQEREAFDDQMARDFSRDVEKYAVTDRRSFDFRQ